MSKRLGQWGEDIAAAFLVKKGYSLVEQNWRCEHGEIDLVMKFDDQGSEVYAFIEVKARADTEFGFPEEAVTRSKLNHLVAACEAYSYEHNIRSIWQIDIVAIIGTPSYGIKDIRHFAKLEI